MQILESEDYRLRPRPRHNPGSHRRQLPAPKLFWREIGRAARRENDVHERCKQRRMLDRIEADQPQRVFEVGEALIGRSIQTKPLPAPFDDWMEWRVLQELRGAPFNPGMRRFRESRMELLDETRLAEAGLAYDQHELALAYASALPAPRQQDQFLLAADKRRYRPRAIRSAPSASANDAEELDRLRHALEFARA